MASHVPIDIVSLCSLLTHAFVHLLQAYCSRCKDFRVQTKRMSLWRLPPVVIIHLKRFQFTQHTRRKLRDFVHFPVEGLDLSRIMAVDNAVGANGEEALSEKDEVVSNGKATQSPELTSDGEKDSAEDDTATVTSSTEEDSAGPSINQDSGRSEMFIKLA